MARNNGKNSTNDFGDQRNIKSSADSRSNIKRWLSPYLDQDDQVWLQDNRDDIPRLVFEFITSLPPQYTLSTKFDHKSDRWLTTLICDGGNDPNSGIAVTGRGSTRINSLYTCLYIASVKLEWAWAENSTSVSGDFG